MGLSVYGIRLWMGEFSRAVTPTAESVYREDIYLMLYLYITYK